MAFFHVITTEFWRVSHIIRARNAQGALYNFKVFRDAKTLPTPQRKLLGSIPEPEQVLDVAGKLVYQNLPPADDAERMLFVEMWRRMRAGDADPLACSMQFICLIKGWNEAEMREEIGLSATALRRQA